MKNKPTFLAYVIYALSSLFLLYVMALQVSPSVITVELMRDFHIDAASLGVLSSAFFYAYTLMQIPAGMLYDRYQLRVILTATILFCVSGIWLFSMTHSFPLAVTGRFMMGLGSTFAFIGVLTVAARYFPASHFALLAGVSQLVSGVGAIAGELPIAASVAHLGWRTTFYYFALFGAVLGLACCFLIRERPHKQTDSKDKSSLSDNLKIILSNKETWWIALYAFCSWTPVAVFAALWGIPYFMQLYGISSTQASLFIASIWCGLIVAGPSVGWLSDYLGRRVILLIALAALGLICSAIIIYFPPLNRLVMSLLLFGFGVAASGQIITFALVKDINKASATSTAVGVNNMAVVAGAALCQPIVGLLLKLKWDGGFLDSVPVYSIPNYQYALMIIPVCSLVALIVAGFFLKEA